MGIINQGEPHCVVSSISISQVVEVGNPNASRCADAPIPEASICLQTCSVCIIRMVTSHARELALCLASVHTAREEGST